MNVFIVPITGCYVISSRANCYSYFTNTGITWSDARQECISRGYDLATITTLEENSLLFSLTSGSSCWIGINDIDNEGTFVWADGSESTYRQWDSGEPSDAGGNEDCGETVLGESWNDQPCALANICYFCSTTGKSVSMYILVNFKSSNSSINAWEVKRIRFV